MIENKDIEKYEATMERKNYLELLLTNLYSKTPVPNTLIEFTERFKKTAREMNIPQAQIPLLEKDLIMALWLDK